MKSLHEEDCDTMVQIKKIDDMWLIISTSLNSMGCGPRKQPKEWQKAWRDWKSAVLKKCASNRSYASGTGGGPAKVLQLTELEDLLATVDADSAGLIDIPEGGNFDRVRQKGCMPQGISKRVLEEHVPLYQSTPFKNKPKSSKNKNEVMSDDTAEILLPSGSESWNDSYSQTQELEDIEINLIQDENTDPSKKYTAGR